MAQSVTGIANRALQLLGAAAIMNLTDNVTEAREAARCYDFCRRAELRAHLWNFATVRAALAPDAAAPVFGYTYQFTLPIDCVRIILPNDAALDWKQEGRKLLTNYANSPFGAGTFGTATAPSPILYLQYVSDVTDPTVFDPLFCEALACRMALAMCERLTQSNQKKQLLQADYTKAISEARVTDAFENLPADPPDDSFWTARIS